ncbi:hypothetical protein T4C_6454, partial [Trichinella pseudospiralis]
MLFSSKTCALNDSYNKHQTIVSNVPHTVLMATTTINHNTTDPKPKLHTANDCTCLHTTVLATDCQVQMSLLWQPSATATWFMISSAFPSHLPLFQEYSRRHRLAGLLQFFQFK